MANSLNLDIQLKGAADVGGMPDVEEDGSTFEENARIKARSIIDKVPAGAWVLADDSGLVVDVLDGEPGVHSARFAGPSANATANNIKLLHLLQGIPQEDRTARFRCALCFMNRESGPIIFTGNCEGHIMTQPSGEEGFGYDPLFRPVGYDGTFGDLPSEVKNSLSHRGKAVEEWADFVRARLAQEATGS